MAMVFAGCGDAEKNMSSDGVGSSGEKLSGLASDSTMKPASSGDTGAEEGDGLMFAEPMDAMAGGMAMDSAPVSESSSVMSSEKSDIAIPPEQEEVPQIEPAAGLLTAGEWRDNQNWGFLVNLVQTGAFQFWTFEIAPYQRVVVHAVSEGAPAKNTRATLYDAVDNVLAEAVTDHTGTAYLYYNVYGKEQGTAEPDHVTLVSPDGQTVTAGLDGAQSSLVTVEPGQNIGGQQEPVREEDEMDPDFTVDGKEVYPDADGEGTYPDSGADEKGTYPDSDADGEEIYPDSDVDRREEYPEPVVGGNEIDPNKVAESSFILRTSELTVELPTLAPQAKQLDVMFVFDTTGSMGDELMYLQKEFEDIAMRVSDQNTRFSVNFYRDQEDDYVVRSNGFLSDIAEVSRLINAEFADGGGDYEEAVDLALYDAVLNHEWRAEAVKLMFLILDAPPHDTAETAQNLKAAAEDAARQGIRIIPIASSGVDKKTEGLLRSLSMITGGTYTFLTDDSGIGGSHLEPTIGSYTVEALNNLIVRLIQEYYGE